MELSEVIKKIDIVEYISQYVDLEWRGEELWGISPFTYPPECTPSFSVRPATGQFYDFSSSIGGNLFTFVCKYHKVEPKKAAKMLYEYAGIDAQSSSSQESSKRFDATTICKRFMRSSAQPKQMNAKIFPDDYTKRYEIADDKLQIWRDEGISDETMRFFDVRYDSFSNRIVYPIRDQSGRIVNIGGRTLDPNYKANNVRKYTYFSGWGGRMAIVFGLFENADAIRAKKEVIIFEGVKSVMLARDFGYHNCASILTSHLNPEQFRILAQLGVRCVFALDKEIDITADRHIEKLRRYTVVEYLFDFENLLGEKDAPVDKGADVFNRLYQARRRYR